MEEEAKMNWRWSGHVARYDDKEKHRNSGSPTVDEIDK